MNNDFEIVTDHISLTYLKNLRSGPSQLARASVQLSQFKFKVNHLAGRKNSAADALSRTENLPTDPLTAKAENRHDEDTHLDLQLTGENPEEVTACDIAIQCELTTDKVTEAEKPASLNIIENRTESQELPTHGQVEAHTKMGLETQTTASKIKFGIQTGNLIEQDTQVIVNPANRFLRNEGGAAKAIAIAAGLNLLAECENFIKHYRELAPPEQETCQSQYST